MDFLLRDPQRLGENIDRVKADARDVVQARGSVHAHLLKGAVDDSELHGEENDEFVTRFEEKLEKRRGWS